MVADVVKSQSLTLASSASSLSSISIPSCLNKREITDDFWSVNEIVSYVKFRWDFTSHLPLVSSVCCLFFGLHFAQHPCLKIGPLSFSRV